MNSLDEVEIDNENEVEMNSLDEVEIDTKDEKNNMINSLIELNYNYLKEKLDKCYIIDNNYNCNDIIECISSKISTDKRLINNFHDDEIILFKKNNRTQRFFTKKGLIKYINEGHIDNYELTCKYFNINFKNENEKNYNKKLESIIVNNKVIISRLLIFLYGKRKRISSLSDKIDKSLISKLLTNTEFDTEINKDKLLYTIDYYKKYSDL